MNREEWPTLFEVAGDGLLVVDANTIIVDANPALCEMFGYSRDELVGLAATYLLPSDTTRQDTDAPGGSRDCAARESGATCAIRKDGRRLFVETRESTFSYKDQPHILHVFRDAEERVRRYELLEQRAEKRTRELATLLDVSLHVGSTLQLEPLLDLILDQLIQVVEYHGASISLLEEDGARIVGYRGEGSSATVLGLTMPFSRSDPVAQLFFQSSPLIINDVRGTSPAALAYQEAEATILDASFRYINSLMIVPMMLNERQIGSLSLNNRERDAFTPHHAALTLAMAQQAATAIENARLYQRAQELAAREERQKLARELHDSVSQALYGIGLGARTARTALDSNPSQAISPLDYVLSLVEVGMAEMRALIFELRPESVEVEGLVTALEKQVEATSARYGMTVRAMLCGEPDVPLPVKDAIYRIAQEALHNVVKHADASSAVVLLTCDDREVSIEVRDNGKGFDPRASFPGHLGQQSMRERAAQLGGSLEVESSASHGTLVRARLPNCDRKSA